MTDISQTKVALVTGGGSGIGKSICLRLAEKQYKVLVLDLSLSAAIQTVNQIIKSSGQAHAYQADVSDHKQIKHLFDEINQQSPIDFLINNAGIAHVGTVEGTSEEDLDRLYNINVKGVYNCISGTIETMKMQKTGRDYQYRINRIYRRHC
jgi:NAD(P)-dependent dehydrogenase (short-subunit alcohol dehydrogenase family)